MTTRKKQPSRPPVLFVGHGSPMNALADNAFTRALRAWGRRLPRPEAVLAVSAHWYADGAHVLSAPRPRTIHDFYGFPQKLYDVQYPAPGHPALAAFARNLLAPASAELSEEWGLDHGTWSVLLHLFPQADVPVFQLSLDRRLSPQEHYELGQRLKPLREKGVLLLGSGNIVHNLSKLNFDGKAPPFPWAQEFDAAVKTALLNRQTQGLINYAASFPDTAPLAAPTPDHYLPLLYALAATDENETPQFPTEGFEAGSISLRSVHWG